ncbi:MAG TPA: glycosyltransferase family 39 protein [Tepidisphaeraceae bacterium]|jgi:hypothetical protein
MTQTASANPGNARDYRLPYLGPLLILLFSLSMLALTWRRWPDILIDFGVQLYTAWQLSEGKLLYRDIAHIYGPLSPWLNAIAFKFLGQSMLSLALLNMLFLAAILTLTYRLLTVIASRLAATIGCLVFVGVFGFGQYMPAGNYNFITPYVAEATHGFLFYLLAAAALHHFTQTERKTALATAAFCTGLLLLTKYELIFAGVPALAVQFFLALRDPSRSHKIRQVLLAGISVLIPLLLAFLVLWTYLSATQSLRALAGPFPLLTDRSLQTSSFYREGLGTDAPLANFIKLLKVLALYLLLLGPLIASLWVRRHRAPWIVLLATFVSAAILTALMPIDWTEIARPFPILMIGALAVAAYDLFCHGITPRRALRLSMILFALLMLAKMILNARVHHYGFVLALPAALMIVAMLTDWLPTLIDRRHGDPNIFIAANLGVLLVVVAIHVRVTSNYMSAKTFPVGTGADTIYTTADRGTSIEQARLDIQRLPPASATLSVVPEGAMLNYLSRRASSIPYLAFLPSDQSLHSEMRINQAFQAHPPDAVVVITRNQQEYGQGNFAIDYARPLGEWIRNHYTPISRPNPNVRILMRKSVTTTPSPPPP